MALPIAGATGGNAASPNTADSSENGRVVRIRSQDGLSLAVRIFDAPSTDRLPLLCLPGLSRNSRDFLALGRFFSSHPTESRRVIAVDYRGRGFSDADPDWRNYKPVVEAEDVLTITAALGVERAILIGTSRGGIISMLIGVLQTFAVAVDYSLLDALRATGIALARTSPLYEFCSIKLATAAPIVPYLLLVLMLIVRPRGLLGKRDV